MSSTTKDETLTPSLFSVGTHSLHLSIHGPPRRPSEPLVVAFTGAGDCTASWLPVSRLLPNTPHILYDRSGLGLSERGPNRSSAVIAASELHALLETSSFPPPYVFCAHSYGAIVAREFFHEWPDEVVGMVLAEGATERQCEFFRIPDPDVLAVQGDLSFAQVTGLRADAKLSREEWRERAKQMARGAETTRREVRSGKEHCETLGAKKQFERRALGERPLSVIRCNGRRDYERIYGKGVEAGNGTAEQRERFRFLLESWDEVDKDLKEEQLRLSSNARLVHIPDCGHNVQLVRPDVVADEIQWVLQKIMKGRDPATPDKVESALV